MDDLTKLIKQRGRVKAKLTAFGNFIAAMETDAHKRAELNSRIERAEALWNEFDTIQNKIEDLDESKNQLVQRTNFEDSYHQMISKARNYVTGTRAGSAILQPGSMPAEPIAIRPNVKLPSIELPKFDGSYERWIPFRDLFESLIASNATLSAVQKLHYLRSSLGGEAAKVIASLELTNDNYAIAWRLLKQRYQNKKLIVQYLIQTLIDLPCISRESYVDLRSLMDTVSQCTQSLTKLDQPVESWNIDSKSIRDLEENGS